MPEVVFNPGALVHARGREWVVEPSSDPSWLSLRPLGGSDDDIQLINPVLEAEPVAAASFDLPDSEKPGSYHSALLLRDALKLKFKNGAGPFRSFGHIAIEPKAYQLAPLLMALKQKTIRLLIADDVGVGKTIESLLIVRELLDRGEIQRFAVLCPPHLVEQWQEELDTHFHIKAVCLTASSVNRLERDVPRGEKFFEFYKAVVISLDYIKQDIRRSAFVQEAPEMIVVDEAHTCTISGYGRQLRYQMLKSLSDDPDRHLLLLTATPHPGKDEAFYNLLSLLRPDFARLPSLQGEEKRKLREDLGAYLVQRQRQDIKQCNFPKRMVKEITYKLKNEWGEFFEDLRDYCYNLAQRVENERGEQRSAMIWYATLALLRCASSSPDAAHKALTNRLTGIEDLDVLMDERLGDGEELASNDEEPCANIEASETLKKLIAKAVALRGSKKDPKLAALLSHITSLISERPAPFRPVIFCCYIATANYVKEHLQEHLKDRSPGAVVDVVTGLLSPEEREQKVEELLEAELPVLVATDCLSEGINLQHGFNAVVHYDLAWNPTRHEQREGRVDRFGQESPEVRCTMIYGQNNPVDGFILNVILKKAQQIKTDLGFQVHLPEDNARIQQALVKAALMKPSRKNQSEFDFGDDDDSLAAIESEWRDAQEKAPANRTIFAQRRLRPQDVIPELKKQEALTGSGDQDVIPELKKQEALTGSGDDVRLFLETALRYLGSPLQQEKEDVWKYDPSQLDPSLRERLAEENSGKPRLLGFKPEQGAIFIHRSHPIVSIIASYILENALEKNRNGISPNSEAAAARCAVFETGSVNKVTTLYILRVRHELDYIMSAKGKHDNQTKKLLAEESLVLGRTGRDSAELLKDEAVSPLMNAFPTGNISPAVMIRELKTAIAWFVEHRDLFDEAAHKRADVLLADHRTVRDASDARGQYNVKACLPADLIGVFVLLPKDI